MKSLTSSLCATILVCFAFAKEDKKPNIVVMLADDLGIGDIGCFGNNTIKTPNVDRIAEEGAKLTQFLAASAMCTPSRAAMLTGRYPIRSGMAGTVRTPVYLFTASSGGLPSEEITFAEVAKKAGYATGLVGKWHQGLNKNRNGDFLHHPLKQGFDSFYGIPLTNLRDFDESEVPLFMSILPRMKYGAGGLLMSSFLFLFCCRRVGSIGPKRFWFFAVLSCVIILFPVYILLNQRDYNSLLMRDYEVVEQTIRLPGLTKRLVQEGVEFLEKQAKEDKPFLLFMSWLQVHTALHAIEPFAGRSKHGKYGDEVEEMDWSVGEILKALDRLGLADNTFVVFSSDQGGHLEERGKAGNVEGGYNGIYRGGKMQGGVDGGIRVPTVVRWPGHIKPGTVIDEPLSNMDLFSTFAEIMDEAVPSDRHIDGASLVPILTGKTQISPHEFMIHYCMDKVHAIRWRPSDGTSVWKVRLATPRWETDSADTCGSFACMCDGPTLRWHREKPLLFDMTNNPREDEPMDVSDPRYVDYVSRAANALKDHMETLDPNTQIQTGVWNVIWKPHLQPCCNFPQCKCTDPKYP